MSTTSTHRNTPLTVRKSPPPVSSSLATTSSSLRRESAIRRYRPSMGFCSSTWHRMVSRMFHSKVVVRAGTGFYYDRGELFSYLSPASQLASSPAAHSASTRLRHSSIPKFASPSLLRIKPSSRPAIRHKSVSATAPAVRSRALGATSCKHLQPAIRRTSSITCRMSRKSRLAHSYLHWLSITAQTNCRIRSTILSTFNGSRATTS